MLMEISMAKLGKKDNKFILMAYTKEIGLIMRNMVKESMSGQMVIAMKVLMLKEKSKVMEYLNGQVVILIKETII